jgi:hypothetical protein
MKAIGYDPLVLVLALVTLGLLISLAFGVTREQLSPIRLEARARASRRQA